MRLARRLVGINGRDHVPSLNLLAAGLAETGDYKGAIDTSHKARQIAQRTPDPALVRLISERLELYQAGRPYHQR